MFDSKSDIFCTKFANLSVTCVKIYQFSFQQVHGSDPYIQWVSDWETNEAPSDVSSWCDSKYAGEQNYQTPQEF